MRRAVLKLNAAVVVLFVVLQLAGARAEADFLTRPTISLLGPLYVLLWFALILWVPITTLAVTLDAGCDKLVRKWRTSRRP